YVVVTKAGGLLEAWSTPPISLSTSNSKSFSASAPGGPNSSERDGINSPCSTAGRPCGACRQPRRRFATAHHPRQPKAVRGVHLEADSSSSHRPVGVARVGHPGAWVVPFARREWCPERFFGSARALASRVRRRAPSWPRS